jgi:glucose/arabinose dehydrogenase
MKRLRIYVAAVAAGALLALAGPGAAAQATAPTGEADRNAPNPSAPGAETTPAPTTLEPLVAAAQAGNAAAMNDLGSGWAPHATLGSRGQCIAGRQSPAARRRW